MSSYVDWIREKMSWNAVDDGKPSRTSVRTYAQAATSATKQEPETAAIAKTVDDDELDEDDALDEFGLGELPEAEDELLDDLPAGADWMETFESPASPSPEKSPLLNGRSPVGPRTPPSPYVPPSDVDNGQKRYRRHSVGEAFSSLGNCKKGRLSGDNCQGHSLDCNDDDSLSNAGSLSSLSVATWSSSDDDYITSINRPRRV